MFHSARLKLTGWYLLFIMTVSLSFSGVIWRVLTIEIDRFDRMQRVRIERKLIEGGYYPGTIPQRHFIFEVPFNNELVDEIRHRLVFALALVNGTILLGSAGLGYMLAGRTLKPIKDMVDEQNRFISDASHELRTPLTSLKSAFEVFLRDKTPTLADARTLARESVTDVNKLQSLTDALLSLAQYRKPNGTLPFETVKLDEVVASSIKKVSPLARSKHIEISYTPAELSVKGNAQSLVDLMVILLDNAVKYSAPKKTVTIQAKKTKGFVRITVTDQGMGIDEKDIGHIFDRFYRADTARSKNVKGGYGLGLAIAKHIADMHQGTITVTSRPKQGSTFTVQLPIK